jgi:uncharacterized membrane protein YfcA
MIVAGTINALAGGGGLITFPLLMLVVAPVTADATSALALFFAYPTAVWRTRSQFEGVFGRGWSRRGDIRHVVALKNFLTLCMRGTAILVLVIEGNVNWNYGVPMAVGGLFGGYLGGTISHRANRTVVRSIVIAIGFAASAYYFWRLYGPAVVRAGAE